MDLFDSDLKDASWKPAVKLGSAVLTRPVTPTSVQQYAVVVLGVAAALGVSLLVQGYAYPRPLFLLALVVSAWGRGLGPSLMGAALAAMVAEVAFPEWLPKYGVVSDVGVFGMAAVISSTFSSAKLRAEAKLRSLCTELEARQEALSRAEQSCRASEVRFRTLADNAPVMIWMSGPDAGCTHFNKPWLDFRGRCLEQELGNGWSEGVHPDDLPVCLETYRSAFTARRPFTMEYRLRRADGEYRWLLDNGIPLYTGGEFTGFIGSCIDVTEHRLAEEQLRVSERRLVDAQRLAQVGSWERYLETDAICWSEEAIRILGRPVDPPASFADFLGYVHPDDREKIKETDHKAASTHGPVVAECRIRRTDGDVRHLRSIAEVIRDAQRRTRILGATRAVVVTTGQDAPEGLLLQVQDSGPGIRPGDLERIFRPFFTTKKGGLGMGLSISRTIIESHGGRIWATANEPHGGRFWVHLPTASADQL